LKIFFVRSDVFARVAMPHPSLQMAVEWGGNWREMESYRGIWTDWARRAANRKNLVKPAQID
jgi:hypothetical protein